MTGAHVEVASGSKNVTVDRRGDVDVSRSLNVVDDRSRNRRFIANEVDIGSASNVEHPQRVSIATRRYGVASDSIKNRSIERNEVERG